MKQFTVIFSPYPLEDLDNAADYYRKISPELELKFLLEIEKKLMPFTTTRILQQLNLAIRAALP